MITVLIAYRAHHVHGINRKILDGSFTHAKVKVLYFGSEEYEQLVGIEYLEYSRNSLEIKRFVRTVRQVRNILGRCHEVYISDPYFSRLYTLAFCITEKYSLIHLLDDGNTSITLMYDQRNYLSITFWRIWVLKSFFSRKVEYSGDFIKKLSNIQKQNRRIEEFDICVIIGSSIVDLGELDEALYVGLVSKVIESFNKVFYCPHPIEKRTKAIIVEREIETINISNLKSNASCCFISFVSSLTIELAVEFQDSYHLIIPISSFIKSPRLRKEYRLIEKTYLDAGIHLFD